MLAQTERDKGGRPKKTGNVVLPVSEPTLAEIGVTKRHRSPACARIDGRISPLSSGSRTPAPFPPNRAQAGHTFRFLTSRNLRFPYCLQHLRRFQAAICS